MHVAQGKKRIANTKRLLFENWLYGYTVLWDCYLNCRPKVFESIELAEQLGYTSVIAIRTFTLVASKQCTAEAH